MKDPSYCYLGPLRFHRAWLMLVACSFLGIGYLATLFGAGGNFFVPVTEELGFARSQMALYQQAHYLTAAFFLPVFGRLYDRVNIRFLLTISAIGCVLGAFLMSTYTQWWQWIISGILYGSFGAGLLYMPQAVILGNWFHERQGLALGISLAAASLAVTIISPLIAVTIAEAGWRSAYVLQAAILAALTLPFTLFIIVRNPKDIGAKPYGLEAGSVESMQTNSTTKSETSLVSGVPFKKGLFSLPFLMLFVFAGVSALIGSGFDAHIPGYAVSVGFSPLYGSFLISALFAGSCVEKIFMGWLNDKIGIHRTVFIELSLVVIGMLGLIIFRNEAALIVAVFIFGTQDSLLSLSVPLLVRKFFGNYDFTRLYAWVSIGTGIVGSFGSPLVALSFDTAGSYIPAFWIAIGVCIFATACLIVARVSVKSLVFVEKSPEGDEVQKQ